MNSSASNFTITTASSADPRFITSTLLLRLGLKVSQLHRPKADGPSLGKIITSVSVYLPSIQQQVTVRISGFGGRGHLTPLLPYMDSSRFASISSLLDWGTTAHVYPAFDLSAIARAIMVYSRVCS